ncbi:MAG TPA: class I SAM-dependent methyltransferase [Roseiarcus sp.]|nr:class I SAM-dependent methyltransferase [Roseiarcus sp.]
MRQGADRSALKERRDDLYETPACATLALMRVEPLPHRIWEPAAGRGAISRELEAAGRHVMKSDLVAHSGADEGIVTPVDFLLELRSSLLADAEAIVTKSPYKNADEFIRRGLFHFRLPVVVLLRLMAMEGANRSDLVDRHLVRVWAGIERLQKFQREGWKGPKQTSETSPFAWFVFSPEDRGANPIALRRMSWRVSS